MQKKIKNRQLILQVYRFRPETPMLVPATESKALNAVVTNATTICFVFPSPIQKAKQKILPTKTLIFDNQKRQITALFGWCVQYLLNSKSCILSLVFRKGFFDQQISAYTLFVYFAIEEMIGAEPNKTISPYRTHCPFFSVSLTNALRFSSNATASASSANS